jgi:hypothetical protein
MDVPPTREAQRLVLEPKGMTLADLVVLVIGCALAFALPWEKFSPVGPAAEWYLRFVFLFLGLQRLCLALGVVVFVRKVRYGGAARPAELLLLLCAMPLVGDSVEYLPWIVNSHRIVDNGPVQTFELGMPYWWWKRTAAVSCVVSGMVFLSVRRRLPGWGSLALISFVMLNFWGGGAEYLQRGFEAFANVGGARADKADLIGDAATVFAVALVYSVATARVLFEQRAVGWTWADRAALGFAVPLMVLVIGLSFHSVWWSPPGSLAEPAMELGASTLVVSLALGFAFAWLRRPKPGPIHLEMPPGRQPAPECEAAPLA